MADGPSGLTGYVLAGGRSSRMGQDKRAMRLGGATLLELAVRKLRAVCGEVVVVGSGAEPGLGNRLIVDRRPGCGPLGGVEAALAEEGGEWAAFLPVDMPLLPEGLLPVLMREWAAGATQGAQVGWAVTDGRPQPLISVVRRELLPFVRRSVETGQWRVRVVFEEAAVETCRARGVRPELAVCGVDVRTMDEGGRRRALWVGQEARVELSEAEWGARELWFSNLNTPEEFAAAARLR